MSIHWESGDQHDVDDGKQLQSTADWSPASASSSCLGQKSEKTGFVRDQKKPNPTGFPEPAPPPPTKSFSSAAATL